MATEPHSNCPYCGTYTYGNDKCGACGKPCLPVSIDVGEVSAAIFAQAKSTSEMLSALVSAHALPLVSLLEGWWNSLSAKHQSDFVTALTHRALIKIQNGFLDRQLEKVIEECLTPDVLKNKVNKLFEEEDSKSNEVLSESIASVIGQDLKDDREQRGIVYTELAKVIREIAKKHSMDQREVIESAVRDRMPDIEKMTKRIVEEIADDAAREVRERMRKS